MGHPVKDIFFAKVHKEYKNLDIVNPTLFSHLPTKKLPTEVPKHTKNMPTLTFTHIVTLVKNIITY